MQNAEVKTLSERADELEDEMMKTLDKVPVKSALYTMGEVDPRTGVVRPPLEPGQHLLMRDDPRLTVTRSSTSPTSAQTTRQSHTLKPLTARR